MSDYKMGWTVFSMVVLFMGIVSLSVGIGEWKGQAAGWGLFGFLLMFKAFMILIVVNAPPGGYRYDGGKDKGSADQG